MNVREPAMMSFMSTSLGCWVCQTKKAVLFRGIFLRAVCCSDTQGWLGFPWPLCLKRGWAKTCATLPWPIRGWSLQFVFSVLTRRSPIGGSGCQGCAAPSGARPGLDAGASGDYIAWPSKDRKTAAARGRPGERLPSCAHPRGLPGHGKPSTASRSAAHSPASKRPLDLPWERSDARGAWGHVATTRSACHRQRLVRHARAPPVPACRACDRGPPAPRPAWYALLPSLAARPRWPSCWCAQRGQALTQEPCGITFQTLARREERPQRTSGRSGTAADLQERSAIRRAPVRG